jgi:predicted MarR family transcription regulator
VVAAKLDSREDWVVRWISMSDLPSTEDVLASRQVIDSEEGKSKLMTTLKKLEKAGYLKSQKSGRELRWQATAAGKEVIA